MLRIDIVNDETLSSSLDQLISGMLPHEKFNPEFFGKILQSTLDYIHVDEMNMEYHVIFSLLIQLKKIQTQVTTFVPMLTKDIIDMTLQSNIFDIVKKPQLRMKEWLIQEGRPDNLEIETTLEMASQVLYERVIELYDRCFSKTISSEEALSAIPALKSAFISNVAEHTMTQQRLILQTGVRSGRSFYVGPEGWLDYLDKMRIDLHKRLESADDGVFHLDSLDKAVEIMDELSGLFEPIGDFDIAPIDRSIRILKHRLLVVVGNENVGKTLIATHLAAKLLRNKRKVLFMYGESPKSLAMARILSAYIYETRKLFITADHIAGSEEVTPEMDRVIKLCLSEIIESKNLILIESLNYYSVFDELQVVYDEHKFDAVFIDHSKALSGGREERTDIESLAVQARRFKKKYPVFMCVLSHLSAMAKELLEKGKRVTTSPTRGSSTLSGEADEVFVLCQDHRMKQQGLIAIDITKTRSRAVTDLVVLNLLGSVSAYYFDPKNQRNFDRNTMSAEAMISQIEESMEDDEDYDYIIEE